MFPLKTCVLVWLFPWALSSPARPLLRSFHPHRGCCFSCLFLYHHFPPQQDDGKLYYGALNGPLKDVMRMLMLENTVARENDLIILSSKFKERLCISSTFESWAGDSNDDYNMKGFMIPATSSSTVPLLCRCHY